MIASLLRLQSKFKVRGLSGKIVDWDAPGHRLNLHNCKKKKKRRERDRERKKLICSQYHLRTPITFCHAWIQCAYLCLYHVCMHSYSCVCVCICACRHAHMRLFMQVLSFQKDEAFMLMQPVVYHLSHIPDSVLIPSPKYFLKYCTYNL